MNYQHGLLDVELNSRKTVIMPVGSDGWGKSLIIKKLLNSGLVCGSQLTSLCYNLDSENMARPPRSGETGRAWINQEIYSELVNSGGLLSDVEAYNGQVRYLFAINIANETIKAIIDYNEKLEIAKSLKFFDKDAFRSSCSLETVISLGQVPVIEFLPSEALNIARKLSNENFDIVMPTLIGVGKEAVMQAQANREGIDLENCLDPIKLSRFALKADMIESNYEHIWRIYKASRNGHSANDRIKVVPLPNIGSLELYEQWLEKMLQYIELSIANNINAESYLNGMYTLAEKQLRPDSKEMNMYRVGAGFGDMGILSVVKLIHTAFIMFGLNTKQQNELFNEYKLRNI